jgi:hypothetical protein
MRYRTSGVLATLLLCGVASVGSAQPGFGPPEGRGGPRGPHEGRGGPHEGPGGPHEGRGGPGGGRGGPGVEMLRMHPVFAALDADGNGELSESEIGNAVSALRGLDKNGDGVLTPNELRPEFGPGGPDNGPGGPKGEGRDNGRTGDRGPSPEGRGDEGRRGDRHGDDRGPGDRGPGDRGPGDRGARGAGWDERPVGGPPHPERFIALAFEYDENHDELLSKEELKKMLSELGPAFGGHGEGRGEGRPEGRGARRGDDPREGHGDAPRERPEREVERDDRGEKSEN